MGKGYIAKGLLLIIPTALLGCYHPPYNNFRKDYSTPRHVVAGAAIGGTVGAVAGYTLPGLGIGAAVGAGIGLYKNSEQGLAVKLNEEDIQIVEYGDLITLVIPTDKYFVFNSSRLNDLQYAGLDALIKFMAYYPNARVSVAGFTDDVGSPEHRTLLSQAQAETMLTFLWSHGFKASQLQARGLGSCFDISDNHLIHGSAQNRRIEIQWSKRGVRL